MKKQFDACIYLYQGSAVKTLTDHTIVSDDPAALAAYYCNNNADRIIVFDQSNTDEEHEEALDTIKKIALACEVPVIGAGNVKRMEDVKKLIYAGCAKAVLNYSKVSNIEITEEVSKKFGKKKILAAFMTKEELTANKELLEEYVSELICLNSSIIKECNTLTALPTICSLDVDKANQIKEYLTLENISGVTGNAVNNSIADVFPMKLAFAKEGFSVSACEASMKWTDFKLNSDGMLPVVVQDYKTNEVLMVAYMNEEAYQHTVETGKMTYWSRSRNELWIKGDTSGHYQYVKSISADCDNDTLLAKVSQVGAACHTGKYSCFFNEVLKKEYNDTNPLKVFEDVYGVIADRKINPKDGSYTNYLFDKGIDKILKKLGEEATEIVIAAKNPNVNEIKYEISDFLYHMMVLMVEKGVTWEEIMAELANR
ncbi:MAG: bifunctional phosphoribosyl-AMP cyclohydrolase/phosphoribosyl-ATP diphosphatase HisIE [Lachnospiraceae bacterium]|nr:bifunctional phosphoribosyl-AMP cyclohydrolase/phosphoribosyl-ATP diphosphatase HisIE [Lachnospiraceae bacterium]